MDWEKQDNELRKLMQDSVDFLPEDERWNKNTSWQKIKQAKEPERKVIPVGLLRYAAAACLIIGISFLGIKYSLRPDIAPRQVKANKEIVVPVESANTQTTDLVDVPINDEANKLDSNQVIVENITLSTTIDDKINNDAKSVHEKLMQKPNNFVKMRESSNDLLAQKEEISNPENLVSKAVSEVALPKLADEVENDVVATKKPMRVIHYNHLSQSSTISPPGFVKQNKLDDTWPAIAQQNKADNNPKDNPLMFKIELTPQTKKSL
jgi:hypothetical protein